MSDKLESIGRIAILLLEDNADDAELVREALKSEACETVITHVDSERKFEEALRTSDPDLIISDFSVPGYGGKAALLAAQRHQPNVPFIFYSGTIGEETAIEALKLGATDYVLKDNSRRLIPAIERALRDGEQRRRQAKADEEVAAQAQLLDLASDAIMVHDLEDRIRYWNEGAVRLYGLTGEQVLGRKPTDLIARVTMEAFQEAKRRTLLEGRWEGEMEHTASSGRQVVVMSRWTLVRARSAAPDRILVINTDVTEKKGIERQLLRAQRLESVGTLASGLAHDLNNILGPILMSAAVLKQSPLSQEAIDFIELIDRSAQRGVRIVKQMLNFVRGTEGERKPVPVGPLLGELAAILRGGLPRNIRIVSEVDPNLMAVQGNATQIHQVLMNLCVNARDAMTMGGTLTIKAANQGGFVRITVADTGTGMPPDVLEKAFDPFFTTKEPDKGTGLGLSTALGIIKSHDGRMKVESKVGAGTTFEILIPGIPGISGEAHER